MISLCHRNFVREVREALGRRGIRTDHPDLVRLALVRAALPQEVAQAVGVALVRRRSR